MFDACSVCRRRLARRAEGSLPRSQWARLEAHLSRCAYCRRIDEADRCLHMALSRSILSRSPMSRDAASAFDDRVLNMVLNQPQSLWRRLLNGLLDRFRLDRYGFPSSFLGQLVGGAFVAASVTGSCLMFALQPSPAHGGTHPPHRQAQSVKLSWMHGPPVPLEALMETPSPRAAILWSHPSTAITGAVAASDHPHTQGSGAHARPGSPAFRASTRL